MEPKDVVKMLHEQVSRLEEKIRQLEETVAWQEHEIIRLRSEAMQVNKTFLRETVHR